MEQIALWDMVKEFEHLKAEKSTDWKWTMANDYPAKNGLKVFSCFACGGGSTMGYKLVGCDVIGCCEIDKRMNDVYVKNHNPKYNYLMDIRDFNKLENLPQELYDLDVLDGSPPCSTFSMAGQREDAWGKEKKFREGQKMQTLDDLLFVFIDTVAKLKPKVAIMENVEGLLLGEAWKYVQDIYSKFSEIGYKVKHWLLKGENMGIPQTRHRVFFVATRLDFDLDCIDMSFNYEPVLYKQIKNGIGSTLGTDSQYYRLLSHAKQSDIKFSEIKVRLGEKESCFTDKIAWESNVLPTITAKCGIYDGIDIAKISDNSIRNAQTFPQDYDFGKEDVAYICGMSVPPIMIKRLMTRLIKSGLFNYKLNP